MARLNLEGAGDRLPHLRGAHGDVPDGDLQPGQGQLPLERPQADVVAGSVVRRCGAAPEQLRWPVVEVGAVVEPVTAQLARLLHCEHAWLWGLYRKTLNSNMSKVC